VPRATPGSRALPEGLIAATELVRDLAYRQLDSKISSSDNYDVKAVGLLAFQGGAIAAVFAAKDAFHGWWGIPALLLLVAASATVAVTWPRRFDYGPEVKAFYECVQAQSAAEANVFLVSELKGSLNVNENRLRQKSQFLFAALVLTLATGISGATILWWTS
jgi:hypothetical protein